MIGAFCDAIKDTDLVDPRRYIAGFQTIPDEIPGFGAVDMHQVGRRIVARGHGVAVDLDLVVNRPVDRTREIDRRARCAR